LRGSFANAGAAERRMTSGTIMDPDDVVNGKMRPMKRLKLNSFIQ
jgi:hypothetical protein